MKSNLLTTILLLIVTSSTLFARAKTDISILGHVIDSKTKTHIPYATVTIKGTTIGVATDITGHYMLNDAPEGVLTIVATCLGYQNQEVEITAKPNTNNTVNFELVESQNLVDEVVVTGNRYATKKRETNSIVNVLSHKLFETTSAVSPVGVLNFQPGSRVEASCGNCGTPQLRINGLSGQYSQVLLDSKPMFSSLGMVYGLEQLPSSMIERIEVIRGGGSALYGSNAIAGIVNIITKEPTTNLLQLSNLTGVIGGNATDVNTSINGSIISEDRKTGAYIFSMVRNREEYDRNDDGFSEMPALSSQTLGFRAFQKIGYYSKLTAEYHYIHENRRGGDLVDLPPHESNLAEDLDHNINGGSIAFEFNSPDEKNSINTYLSAQKIDRKSYFGTEKNIDAYGKSDDLSLGLGAQWIHRMDKFLFMPSILTTGIEASNNELSDQMLGYNREINQTTRVIGAYAQNEWKVDKFSLLIGGRLDKTNMLENPVFSPRASVRYAPNENFTFRTSYARGYRAPQIYDEDLHVTAVGGSIAIIELSPDLKAEHSNSLNLSMDYWNTFGSWQLNFLVEGFYTDLQDVFGLKKLGDPTQGDTENNEPEITTFQRVNESGAYVAGINTELRLAYLDKINIQAGYTYQKSRYDEAVDWSPTVTPQKKMFRTPDNYSYITVDYKPLKDWTFSVNGIYTGKMLVQHVDTGSNPDEDVVTPTFFELDLRAAYDFNITKSTKIQLSIAAKNVLDQFQDDLDIGMTKDSKFFYGPLLPRSIFFGAKLMF